VVPLDRVRDIPGNRHVFGQLRELVAGASTMTVGEERVL